jgi:hypothetical protein
LNRKGRKGYEGIQRLENFIGSPDGDALPLINSLFYLANLRVLCGEMQFKG